MNQVITLDKIAKDLVALHQMIVWVGVGDDFEIEASLLILIAGFKNNKGGL